MTTYIISNEQTGTSKKFTSKRAALKQMAEQNRSGERYNCYVYRDGRRVDNGTIDAENCIRGY